MTGHAHDVFDAGSELKFGEAFAELRRNVEEHLVELVSRLTDALDFVGRLHGARVAHCTGAVDDFRFLKVLRDLLVGGHRQDVQLEADCVAGIRDEAGKFGISLQWDDVFNRRFHLRPFVALAYSKQRLALPWKPQNTGLDRAGQIIHIDVLQDNERVAVHEAADSRPSAFQLVPGYIFHNPSMII